MLNNSKGPVDLHIQIQFTPRCFKNSDLISFKIKETFDFNLSTAINDEGSMLNSATILLTAKYVDSNEFFLKYL